LKTFWNCPEAIWPRPIELRLDRRVLEIGAPEHRALALLHFRDPAGAVGEALLLLALARHLDEQLERRFRVRHDAEVGSEHAPDLHRLDVDVHELAPLGVDLDRAGVAVGPAVAQAEHEIALEKRRVPVPVLRLEPDHAGHERMVVRDRAPAHERRDHRRARQLGELDQQIAGVGVDHAAPGDDHRALRLAQQVERGLDLLALRARLVHLQRHVEPRVVLDQLALHVERQVDEHRPRAAGAHDAERLAERPRHLRRLEHRHRPLRHRAGDRGDVDRLEVLLVQLRLRRLAGDAEDRDGVGGRRVQAGDHVGAGRTGGADVHADLPGSRARVALGHVATAFLVAHEHVLDLGVPHRVVERQDRRARDPEDKLDPLALHHAHCGFGGGHLRHRGFPP
jgi:hypothetical protein